MNQMGGEKPLRHLFQPVKWVGFDVHVGGDGEALVVSHLLAAIPGQAAKYWVDAARFRGN